MLRQKVRNYRLPNWEFKYKSYFKDLVHYVEILKREIWRVRNCRDYNDDEKVYIINKKIKPFFYERQTDIEYGKSLLEDVE